MQQMILRNSYFVNAYSNMFYIPEVINLMIHSSHFMSNGFASIIVITGGFESKLRYILIENNTFQYTDKKRLSHIDTGTLVCESETRCRSLVLYSRLVYVSQIEIISNYFEDKNDNNLPQFKFYNSDVCLSNNTFHNYAIYLSNSTLRSCYKKNMLQSCRIDQCCNDFGEINEILIDQKGYFILNNTSIQPITTAKYNVKIGLENIVFQILDNRTNIQLPNATQLLYTDITIDYMSDNNVDFTFMSPKCKLLCNQIMNEQFTTQIKMKCQLQSNTTNALYFHHSSEWNQTELISHATPHSLIFNPSNNGLYFPGEFMKFDYYILDQFGNIIPFTEYNKDIAVTVSIESDDYDLSHYSSLFIDKNGYCYVCDSGLYIPSITLQHITAKVVLNIEDDDRLLTVYDINIFVIECPKTHVSDSTGTHCTKIINIFPVWIIILLAIGGSIIVLLPCIVFICRRNIKLNKELQRQKQFEHKIYNPMVLSIGIAYYNELTKDDGFKGYCDNLNGIDRDYANLKTLCKAFKYDIFPKYEQYEWNETEIISFLNNRAEYLSKNVNINACGNVNGLGYDGLFVIFSGHGYNNKIITSDYQMMSKTAIHRLFSRKYPILREIPRIFIMDVCDGAMERDSDVYGESDEEESEDNVSNKLREVATNQGKNIPISTVNRYVKGKNFLENDINLETNIWARNQKNPDFKLIIIHAANEGFQAKMNSVDGSYLIYCFVKQMMRNADCETNEYLGEIFDSIQETLHDLGKQQIKIVFNNHTRYLKLQKNDKREDELFDGSMKTNANGTEVETKMEETKTEETKTEETKIEMLALNEQLSTKL
eukprot:464326_1